MPSSDPDLTLPGSVKMPQIGLGTFGLKEADDADCIEHALDTGYRLLDTAYVYGNEKLIGDVLQKRIISGRMKREDVFVTTKIPPNLMSSPDLVRRSLDISLSRLQLDYVDLFLMHSPCGFKYISDEDVYPKDENGKPSFSHDDIVVTWKAMESLVDLGLTRTIGVSNFNVGQLQRIREIARIPVSNLQVEGHVYLQQRELLEFCQAHGISLTLYGNLGGRPKAGSGKPSVLDDPVVAEVAASNNITKGQVLLSFLVTEGFGVIPKSSNKSRLDDNFKVGSIHLPETDLKKLRSLDAGLRYYDLLKYAGGHPEYPY